MAMSYKLCVEMGKITKFEVGLKMVKKELDIGKNDLQAANESLTTGGFKWATIQGYYAFFHAVRSLLFLRKFREKSHRCLRESLKVLYIDKGLVPPEYYDKFAVAMDLRESADYKSIYSKKDALLVISDAKAMIEIAEQLILETPENPEKNK
ncbi:MAG: HEPN domain-containing protein [Fibrobacterota bacterium]